MKKIILALALLFAPTLAFGQCNGVFTAGTVCGSTAGGVPGAVTLPALGERTRLVVPTTFYVDGISGSNSNDCLSPSTACLTTGNTFSKIIRLYDIVNTTVTVQLAAGQTWNNITWSLTIVGSGSITLDGGNGTITSANANPALTLNNSTKTQNFNIQNVTITNTSSGDGLYCGGGLCNVLSGVTFGAAGKYKIHVDGGGFFNATLSNYTDIGNAQAHVFVENPGSIANIIGITITETGTPVYSSAYAYSWDGALIFYLTNTFSGSVTGPRYFTDLNGIINTNGGGANYIPGNSAGVSIRGGLYDSPGTPGVSSCGTSPGAAVGNDFSGHVTEGTTATGCTITFTTASTMTGCTANLSTGAAVGINTVGATLVVVHGSLSSNVLYWNCKS